MGRRPPKPPQLRRACGLTMLSMGFGMFLVLIMPGCGFIIAALLITAGFWALFM